MWKRQQLFHATDFQSLIYPNFTFSRALGILPHKISASTLETSKLPNIMRTFVFGAFCIYELMIFYKIVVSKTASFVDVTHTLQCSCYYTFGGFIGIVTYASNGPSLPVLRAVLKTSSRLSPESYRKLSRWIHMKDILGTFFIVVQTSVYYFKFPEHLPFYALGIYIDLLIFQMDMLYMNCVCVLKACFRAVNDNLARLQAVVRNEARYVPGFICDKQKNQLLLIKLKSLKKQHLITSNVFQTLNVIFSLQLVVTITLTFTDVTFELYSHLIQWKGGLSLVSEISDVSFSTAMTGSVTTYILILAQFLMMTHSCDA